MISVIIPCYNAEKFIDRTIESIVEQDYPRVELVIVNDGSTDGSEEKIFCGIKIDGKNDTRQKNRVLFYYEFCKSDWT